jgi:hypothetical protein
MIVKAIAGTITIGKPFEPSGGRLGVEEFEPGGDVGGGEGFKVLSNGAEKLTRAAAILPRMILNSSHARNVRSVANATFGSTLTGT